MVKFADMPEGSKRGWLLWANSHDWGATSAHHFDSDGELVTFCAAQTNDGKWYEERAVHQTPADLKAWAGY